MAGFEVIIYGRFWVIAEEPIEWTAQGIDEYKTLIEGFLWDQLEITLFGLRQLGIPPCCLIAALKKLEQDGTLESCSLCSHAIDDGHSESHEPPPADNLSNQGALDGSP